MTWKLIASTGLGSRTIEVARLSACFGQSEHPSASLRRTRYSDKGKEPLTG
jgi:hypothetical protein